MFVCHKTGAFLGEMRKYKLKIIDVSIQVYSFSFCFSFTLFLNSVPVPTTEQWDVKQTTSV
jgi:hypothetical protein